MDSRGWMTFQEREPEESDAADGTILVWHILQGAFARPAGVPKSAMYTHWKRIPRAGWIAAADRKPAIGDADPMGCVLARSESDGTKVTGWHQFEHDTPYTHWMPTPEGPEDAEEYRRRFWKE